MTQGPWDPDKIVDAAAKAAEENGNRPANPDRRPPFRGFAPPIGEAAGQLNVSALSDAQTGVKVVRLTFASTTSITFIDLPIAHPEGGDVARAIGEAILAAGTRLRTGLITPGMEG